MSKFYQHSLYITVPIKEEEERKRQEELKRQQELEAAKKAQIEQQKKVREQRTKPKPSRNSMPLCQISLLMSPYS